MVDFPAPIGPTRKILPETLIAGRYASNNRINQEETIKVVKILPLDDAYRKDPTSGGLTTELFIEAYCMERPILMSFRMGFVEQSNR